MAKTKAKAKAAKPAEDIKLTMSDEAIAAKTGKGWDAWFAALDKAGAAKLDHKAIATIARDDLGAGAWYGQMIAVSYERARGIRAANQKCGGVFSVGVSKVLPVPLPKLFATATAKRSEWFPKGAFEETSRTTDKYWRGKWNADARLSINFYAKGEGKASITIDCEKLADNAAVERERAAWKAAVERLAGLLKP